MKFGEWLKSTRTAQNIWLEDLAEKSKVSPGTISRIENQKVDPVVETAIKLVAAISTPSEVFAQIGIAPTDQYKRKDTTAPGLRVEQLTHWITYVHANTKKSDAFLEKWLIDLEEEDDLPYKAYLPPTATILEGISQQENRMVLPPFLPRDFLQLLYNNDEMLTFRDVGYYVRQVRIARNLSLRDVEKLTGMDDTLFLRVENGQLWSMKLEVMHKLHDFMNDGGLFVYTYWQATGQHLQTQIKIVDMGKKYLKNPFPIRVRMNVLIGIYRWVCQTPKQIAFLEDLARIA